MKTKNNLIALPVATADGEFTAHYSEKGLARLNFPKSGRAVKPRVVPAQTLRWHGATTKALKSILAGREPKEFPPLDLAGTDFQKSVWRQMRKISLGKTKSYGEIAAAIRNPKAVRAVGGACGANLIPVLVPCHRVLAANKKLGGFSGGLDWKRELLAREGILIQNKIEDKAVREWSKAATDLGFQFTSPFIAKLPNGRCVECLGLVHKFGASIGTLISLGVGPSAEVDYPSLHEGYGQSCLGYSRYNRKEWINILCDWGYWGPRSQWPKWFSPGPVCHLQYTNEVIPPSAG